MEHVIGIIIFVGMVLLFVTVMSIWQNYVLLKDRLEDLQKEVSRLQEYSRERHLETEKTQEKLRGILSDIKYELENQRN